MEASECKGGFGDPNGYAAVVYLYAADITLEQTAGPTAGSLGGELASAPIVSGTSDLTFNASDPGSGVYQAVFTVDGQVVQRTVLDENGGRCRNVGQAADGLPAFLYIQPCRASVSSDVAFDTTKKVYATEKSNLNYLVLDSGWEAKVGQVLDAMDEVADYVKNQGLNFKVPYTFEGEPANYVPDLIVRIDNSAREPLNLIIEVTGQHRREKAAKVATALTYWIPAVNNLGSVGRWSFLEVTDPWDAANLIRAHVQSHAPAKATNCC